VAIDIVEGIVEIRRFRLTFVGQPDHAGTTPMDRRRRLPHRRGIRDEEPRAGGARRRAARSRPSASWTCGVPNIVPSAALLQEPATPTVVLERLATRTPRRPDGWRARGLVRGRAPHAPSRSDARGSRR
jgi:hypothetical protein